MTDRFRLGGGTGEEGEERLGGREGGDVEWRGRGGGEGVG